jgi:hypothetical protein
VQVGQMQRRFLSGGGDQQAFGHGFIIIAAKTVAPHFGQVIVAQMVKVQARIDVPAV